MRAHPSGWKWGYHVLIVAMLASLPLESILGDESRIFRTFWLLMPFAAAVALARRGWRLIGALALAVTSLGIALTAGETSASFALAAAFVFVTVVMLSDVFSHPRVTGATVSGALCAFVLIGVVFALVYRGIIAIDPGAFRGSGPESPSGDDMAYFSIVTLTTLGYGDITPVSDAARNIAMFEALVGQLYLVAVVARLVGLSVANPPEADAAG